MQRIENSDFVVELTDDSLKVWMKGPGVEATIEPIGPGMIIAGGGHHPLLAHGRDFSLIVLDRELIGEASRWEKLR